MPLQRPSLRFTHVLIRSWRNFVKAEASIGERLLVTGPCGAGKTNFLDAFRFLSDLATPGCGFQRAVQARDGVRRLRCLAARHDPDICLAVRVGDESSPAQWEYELHFNQDGQRPPVIQRESLTRGGEEVLGRPDEEDRADAERLEQSALEQGGTRRELREFVRFLRSVRYVHPSAAVIRDAGQRPSGSLQPYGAGLIARMASMPERSRQARLRAILEELAGAVPKLRQLEAHFDPHGRPRLRALLEHWRPRGAWLDEEHLPDGTLRLIALMWSVLESPGPLLLEEPEISLHPQAARLVPRMIERLARRNGCQTILTTHSLDVLCGQGVDTAEVALLNPGDDGTALRAAFDLKEAADLLDTGVLAVHQETEVPERQLGLF